MGKDIANTIRRVMAPGDVEAALINFRTLRHGLNGIVMPMQ